MVEPGGTGKPPVFIVGSPRSGSSLLRHILSRHPALAICGETRFFADIYQRRSVFGPLDVPENRRRLVEQYLKTARARRLELDLAGLKEQLLRDGTSYPDFFASILRFCAASQGKYRCGEKTPHHAFFTETLCAWYPGAAIIHLVRDPRDVVASLQSIAWGPNSILNNAWIWRLFNRAARRSRHQPGYLLVHYEQLVHHPEQELARICAHLGEAWAPSMLLPKDATAGPYAWPRSARGPVVQERMEKWREQLSAQDTSLIEWIAGQDMEGYGYQREGRSPAPPVVVRGLVLAMLDTVRRQVEQLPCVWTRLMQPADLAKQEYWRYRNSWEIVFPGLPSFHERIQ